jgi:hypothetical protein
MPKIPDTVGVTESKHSLENKPMKAFIVACVAAIALAAIGSVVLNGIQKPAEVAFSTSGVRL